MSETREAVGFVGAGLMGQGMAANVAGAGFPLTVIAHRNRQPIEALVARGAVEAGSLAELAGRSRVIVLCLPNSDEVEKVVAGLRPGLAKGTVIVDCSTADPNSTLRLAASLADGGVDYADAPLGGTPKDAAEGKLSSMVGATEAVFARIRPVLSCFAVKTVHLGEVGAGHKMKLLNNFLSLGYGAIYAEALTLAAKVGISVAQFDSVIRGGRMDCGFYQTFMGYALEGNREAHRFTLTNALKDMRYLDAMAASAPMVSLMASAARNTYATAVAGGADGPEDYVPHLVDHIGRANGVRKAKP